MSGTPSAGAYAVGVDLGGTNVKAALVERAGGIVARTSLPTDAEAGPERVLDCVAEAVGRVLAHLPDGAAVGGLGIGSPGVVSLDRRTVRRPPNFPGWDEVVMPDALGTRLAVHPRWSAALPVLVENDANVAGLGSAFYGAGRAFPSFVMVTLGTGVGGAIVHERRLFRGVTGAAGEIGHVSIDYEGPYSRAGVAGAIEAYLGQRYLSHHARHRLLARDTELHETAGADLREITPEALHHAAADGDEEARAMLSWAGHKLGVMLGSVVNLLDIRKVVVGGGVSAAGDFLLNPARKALRRAVLPAMLDGVEIVQETQGNDVALLGAARLVFEADEDADG